MTYDLRRLRLHALIRRIPGTHRYLVTAQGLRVALFFTRAHARLLRPKLADIFDPLLEPPPRSVGLSTASIRRSNDAASNSTLLPENLTRSHQLLKSKII
jgi:hypothetical protein